MDRETVITHLQIIHTWAEFARERDLQFFTAKHLEDIAKWSDDVIALLEEQEPKPVEICGKIFDTKVGDCPHCEERLNSEVYPHWCGFCGQAVKWQ